MKRCGCLRSGPESLLSHKDPSRETPGRNNDLHKIQMRYNMKFIFNTLFYLLFISANISAQVPAEKVPDFNFLRLNKQPFTTKDLEHGKMLFFVFFDADCGHCQHAINYLNQHYKEIMETSTYLVSMDSQEKINVFMNKFGNNLKDQKNITLLQDFKYEFITKFKPRKYPSIFLYSSDKKLLIYDDNEKNMQAVIEKIKAVKTESLR
jgi:peroxiredoxin